MINWLLSIFGNNNNNVIYDEKVDAESENTAQEPEEIACYACHQFIEKLDNLDIDDILICPYCKINNTLVRSSKLIRTERLEIYHKYDGDPYNYNSLGLIGRVIKDFDDEIALAKRARKCEPKHTSQKEYKFLYGKLYRKKEKAIQELEEEKSKELKPLLDEEKLIRKKLKDEASKA